MNSLIENKRTVIGTLCQKYHVNKLFVFGSVLSDKFSSESDIDMIVDFEKMQVEDYVDNYYDFKFSLEDLFMRPVDLLEQQTMTNPYFNKKVDSQKQLIYGR